MFIGIGLSVTGLIFLALAVAHCITSARNAFLTGQRVAYRTSISYIKQRADLALLLAPRGRLQEGLQRAHTAAQIERDLRDLLAGVR